MIDGLLQERSSWRRGMLPITYRPDILPMVRYSSIPGETPTVPQGPSAVGGPTVPQGLSASGGTEAVGPRHISTAIQGRLKPIRNAGGARLVKWVDTWAAKGEEWLLRKVTTEMSSAAVFNAIFEADNSQSDTQQCKVRTSGLTPQDVQDIQGWGVARTMSRSEWRRTMGRTFKVWKSDNITTRFILDCALANLMSNKTDSFRIAQPIEVARLLAASHGAWSSDLANWFFQLAVPAGGQHKFAFRTRAKVMCMLVLAMGWCHAPRIGHTLTCALSGSLVRRIPTRPCETTGGLVIIDNTLLVACSDEDLRARIRVFEERCREANVLVGEKDDLTVTDSIRITHGGIKYRLTRPGVRWRLKDTWRRRVVELTTMMAHEHAVPCTWARWRSILGCLVWACRALEVPLVILQPVWAWASSRARRDEPDLVAPLSDRARSSLLRFAQWLAVDPEREWAGAKSIEAWLWTDACRKGWGGVYWYEGTWSCYSGVWDRHERAVAAISMPWAEMRAVVLATRAIEALLPEGRLIIVTDCMPVFWSLLYGRCSSDRMAIQLRELLRWSIGAGLQWSAGWVPSESQLADAPSRGRTWCRHDIIHPIFYPHIADVHFPMATCTSGLHSPTAELLS